MDVLRYTEHARSQLLITEREGMDDGKSSPRPFLQHENSRRGRLKRTYVYVVHYVILERIRFRSENSG